MFWPAARSALAIFLGVLLAGSLIGTIEGIGRVSFPASPEARSLMESLGKLKPDEQALELAKPEVRRLLEELSPAASAVIVVAWMVGAVLGSWTAGVISRRNPLVHGLVAGGLLLTVAVLNSQRAHFPLWMTIAAIVLFPPAAFMGGSLAGVRLSRHVAPRQVNPSAVLSAGSKDGDGSD